MRLRTYQEEFVSSIWKSLCEYNRVLAVQATGGGKTICAAELIRKTIEYGPVLFLADAKELVHQGADKIAAYTGEFVGVEMAKDHAELGDRIIVATTQSIGRRLEKYPKDYFKLIIVDEAHRNTLGQMAANVLEHFDTAKVVGITATPFRSDKKQLSEFYEAIPTEIGLVRLIEEGFLSRITIKQVPLSVDLKEVRNTGGDYNAADLGEAIEPHLREAAKILAEHAAERRTVAFLPLIATSKMFADICNEEGLKAVHVDGVDRTELDTFRSGEANVICNASLLTTGWDEPSVDCVFVLRPTRSQVLYSQMVGRGTRIFEGKDDMLLLDPLFLTEKHDLIRPARLIAKSEKEAAAIQIQLDAGIDDLLEAEEGAVEQQRHDALVEAMKRVSKRKAKTIDAVEFALSLGDVTVSEYEPEMKWESAPVSEKQAEILSNYGFDPEDVQDKGHASKIIDLLFTRRGMGLASPKQVKWLAKMGHPDPSRATFEEAGEFLNAKFNKKSA